MVFDIIFGIFIAFSQILMFFMGLLFFCIGALLFIYPLWQRFTWLPVKARIVEVRARTSPFQNKTEETQSESAPHQSVDLLGDVKKSRGKNLSALVVIFLIMGVPLLFVGVGAYFALDYLHLKRRVWKHRARLSDLKSAKMMKAARLLPLSFVSGILRI